MTKAIVAALLAAGSIISGAASAQDRQGRGDRPQQTDAQREARAERRAERQAGGQDDRRGDRGQADRGRMDRGQQGQRSDLTPQDRAERRADRQDDGRQPGRIAERDGGRYEGGRYDRTNANRYNRNPGWERRGYDAQHFSAGSPQRWSNGWRHDGRYDWNRYRSYNREAYRLPRYYAPGGWGYGYRRFSIGARIAAPLFGRNYWIDDPWAYRLPEAYGPYRWVRYYDDAVLVDLRTGYVVDMVYGIFW